MRKIILDTNVLLVSLPQKSKYHGIFKELLKGNYTLCVTTEILLEYEEILIKYLGLKASEIFLSFIETSPYVELVTVYYKFNLLQDKDDNKFVDCVIASGAHAIVTHDKDFNLLKKIHFPKVTILNADEFIEILSRN